MRINNNQVRETLIEAAMRLIEKKDNECVLFEIESGSKSLWVQNDKFAGYVVEIDGIGYEFVSEVEC